MTHRPQPPPDVVLTGHSRKPQSGFGENHLLRIDAVWAFVSVDEQGNEGVCAATFPGLPGVTPLIAADEARLASLIPMARHLARVTGMPRKSPGDFAGIRLIRLSVRSELLLIGPDGQDEQQGAPS